MKRRCCALSNAAVTARETGLVTPERVVDVQFRELMADPIAAIRKIYDKFDLELTDVAADRMRRHLAANPDDKHGKHGHTFADTGLDVGLERMLRNVVSKHHAAE